MPAILALDLGTKCGHALLRADSKIESGMVDLSPKSKDGKGARYSKFGAWLGEMKQLHPDISHVAYEVVMAHGPGQVYAAHVYGGLQAMLQMFCDRHGITYETVGVSTIKLRFAGAGNASKEDVIRQCRTLGFNPGDDNEADAIALLHVVTGRCPLLTMNGASPKKRTPKPTPELKPGEMPF